MTDDEGLAILCTCSLEEAGYEVSRAAHSGHALLQCLSGARPDILLTELWMPDGSGPALAERLRRYNLRMQVLFFASQGTLLQTGNVLLRPFSRGELLASVRSAVISSQAS